MLTTTRAMDCPSIRNRQVALAREAGVNGDLIDALLDKRPLPPMSELEIVLRTEGGYHFFHK
jgi:hypothetical protein